MSLKLDWDVESEQGKHQQHQEDFRQRSRRYLVFLRFLLVIAVFLAIIGVVVFGVLQRWNQVNSRLEQLLRDTVEAEIAALRIGDFDSYINIQRSATDDWYVTQEQSYEAYQQLKVNSNVTLTGQILDIAVDGQRGRVQVQEIINGVPYVRTWFYWRYPEPDGWRHVPPDYTFWGDAATLERPRFVVRYRSVDELTARGLADNVARWLDEACSLLDCRNLPPITFDIVTEPLSGAVWAPNEQEAWQMIVPSPYLDRARADMPFDQHLQLDTATLLATRFANTAMPDGQPVYPHDAHYLHSAVVAWMVGRFVQLNPESYLVESLVTVYGTEYISQLMSSLQPTSDIGLLSAVVGAPSLAEMNLDWRDFVEWRLNVEFDLIQRGDEANWQRLYDFRDEALRQTAYARYNANNVAQVVRVVNVTQATTADGTPQLQALVQVDLGAETAVVPVVFNLVNNVWLRAS